MFEDEITSGIVFMLEQLVDNYCFYTLLYLFSSSQRKVRHINLFMVRPNYLWLYNLSSHEIWVPFQRIG